MSRLPPQAGLFGTLRGVLGLRRLISGGRVEVVQIFGPYTLNPKFKP